MINKELNAKSLSNVNTMVVLAMLASLSVMLELFLGINTGSFKLHFGYLPVAAAGMLYGTLPGALVGLVADILSNLRNFSLAFAALAVLEGAVYGIFLHQRQTEKKKMLMQAIVCQLVVSLVIQAGLNTLLLWVLYRSFNPIRFVSNALTFPVKVYTLYLIMGYRSVFEKHV